MNTTGPSLATAKRIMRDLAAKDVCERCGKSRIAVATGWKGRGTGSRGGSHFDATSFTETCQCPKAVQS